MSVAACVSEVETTNTEPAICARVAGRLGTFGDDCRFYAVGE